MSEVTFWPIFFAAIISTLLGWIWYHPKVFGAKWMRMIGVTPEMVERGKKRMVPYTLVAFLGSMIVAYVMSYFALAWAIQDVPGAIQLGFWLWIGFTAPPMLGMVLWEHKPLRLYLIVSLYWLITFIAMANVLVFGSRISGVSNSGANIAPGDHRAAAMWPEQSLHTVVVRDEAIRVDVADTPESRERGLSGRSSLAPNEGMLFVFQEDGKPAFWMKDMNFSIDMLWIATDGTIVYIVPDVAPDTYPSSFAPSALSRYVLELPAGYVQTHSVAIGDHVHI